MARVTLALVVVVLTVAIQGAPQATYDQIVNAAKSGNWDQFQAYLNSNLANQPNFKPLNFDSIRDLKPVGGGQVYGEAEYTYQSVSNVNGAQTEESGGHKLINDNGHVNEFDLKP